VALQETAFFNGLLNVRQPFLALEPAAVQDQPAPARLHAGAEPALPDALDVALANVKFHAFLPFMDRRDSITPGDAPSSLKNSPGGGYNASLADNALQRSPIGEPFPGAFAVIPFAVQARESLFSEDLRP
jgi:hypothetical protein